jgi:predicted ATPase
MITSVAIENFKNLRSLEVGLEPLTVFVGPNASGKTSVLEALHLAVNAARAKLNDRHAPHGPHAQLLDKVFRYERHCDWLYTRCGEGDLSITCITSAGTFAVNASPPRDFPPQQTDMLGSGRWTLNVTSPDSADLEHAMHPARSMVFLHLNARQLAKASYSDRTRPRVKYDGEGLASVLAYMALNDPDRFDGLVKVMRTLIPHLKRIRFSKAPVCRIEKELVKFGDDTVERRSKREYQGDVILFDFKNADNISAHTVSEGTLMLLGLLTVLLGPAQPKILLMDDIEHGLHPLAQKALLDVVKKVMQEYAEVQIIASAHSPYLLDQLQPDQIRLMTLDKDGHSVCGRLADNPQFDWWKAEMAPGELWSLFGESWLAEKGEAQ